MRTSVPKCVDCDASLGAGAARTLIAGQWRCSDCTYELEYGVADRRLPKRQAPRLPQEEGLFPLPSPASGRRPAA
jgi:hypothetical protein